VSAELLSVIGLVVGLLLTVGIVLLIRQSREGITGRTATNRSATNPPVPDNSHVTLRLHGSNTIGSSLAVELAKEFLKQQGATNIAVVQKAKEEMLVKGTVPGQDVPQAIEIYAHGSATGFTDLAAGKCDIAMASRKIEPPELTNTAALGDLTSEANENVIALDGVAVIVNRSNPARTLTVDQIRDLFSGAISDWSNIGNGYSGPVHVNARDDKSGTWETFRTLVMGKTALAPGSKRFEDSSELSRAVSGDPNGIGFIGLPYVLAAKAVAVAEKESDPAGRQTTVPLVPNAGTVATEDYPLSRRLYFYTASVPANSNVQSFIQFAKSDTGQDLVAKAGFVSQKIGQDSPTPGPLPDAPRDYTVLTSQAVRQPLDFHFRYGSSSLDPKALDDVERMARFLHDSRKERGHVILLGFADSKGSPQANKRISEERAKAVNAELERQGAVAFQIVGLGAEMPIKSNDTPAGREKNRRVEVWVK